MCIVAVSDDARVIEKMLHLPSAWRYPPFTSPPQGRPEPYTCEPRGKVDPMPDYENVLSDRTVPPPWAGAWWAPPQYHAVRAGLGPVLQFCCHPGQQFYPEAAKNCQIPPLTGRTALWYIVPGCLVSLKTNFPSPTQHCVRVARKSKFLSIPSAVA